MARRTIDVMLVNGNNKELVMPKLERHFHVKWAGPNTPYIRFCKNDERIYLSKRELVALAAEIDSFTRYYKEDFMEGRIDIQDEPYDENI